LATSIASAGRLRRSRQALPVTPAAASAVTEGGGQLVSSLVLAEFLGLRRNHGGHAREDTAMTMRLREFTLRYSAVNDADGSPLLVGRRIERPSDAAPALVTLLKHEAVEVFAVLCLSTKRRVLGYYEVSRGTLDATLVHPRDVFKVAVLAERRWHHRGAQPPERRSFTDSRGPRHNASPHQRRRDSRHRRTGPHRRRRRDLGELARREVDPVGASTAHAATVRLPARLRP
jgi:hypothetical protein